MRPLDGGGGSVLTLILGGARVGTPRLGLLLAPTQILPQGRRQPLARARIGLARPCWGGFGGGIAGRRLVVHGVSGGPGGLLGLWIGEIRDAGKGLLGAVMAMQPGTAAGRHPVASAPSRPKNLFHPSWLATRQSLWHKPGVA